jgi:hypothetical protein
MGMKISVLVLVSIILLRDRVGCSSFLEPKNNTNNAEYFPVIDSYEKSLQIFGFKFVFFMPNMK